jgi:hypothetical protein
MVWFWKKEFYFETGIEIYTFAEESIAKKDEVNQ